MRAVQILDKALGPLSPSRQAHASAPNAKRVLVFGANEPQGLAVADTLSKKGKYVVTAVFEDMDHPHTDSESPRDHWNSGDSDRFTEWRIRLRNTPFRCRWWGSAL